MKTLLRGTIIVLMVVGIAFCMGLLSVLLTGCNEVQRQPRVWGQGELPAEWEGFFGNGNGARLDYMQSKMLDQQGVIIFGADTKGADGKSVRKRGLIERITALEGMVEQLEKAALFRLVDPNE